MGQKRVVGARADAKGNISGVRFQGNSTMTPIAIAVGMAERGEVANAHAVKPKSGVAYLRTNPDGKTGNNLDTLAGET